MNTGVRTDEKLYELENHGDYFFPLKIRLDDLSEFPNSIMGCHWHSEIEYNYVLKGVVEYQIFDQTYIVHQNEGLFINSNCLHMAKLYQCENSIFFCIVFQPNLLYGFSGSTTEQKYVTPLLLSKQLPAIHFQSSAPQYIACNNRIREIYEIYNTQPFGYKLEIQIRLQQIWLSMLRNNPNVVSLPVNMSSHDEKRLKTLLAFIEENYASKLTLDQIAASANISKSECCRFLKKEINILRTKQSCRRGCRTISPAYAPKPVPTDFIPKKFQFFLPPISANQKIRTCLRTRNRYRKVSVLFLRPSGIRFELSGLPCSALITPVLVLHSCEPRAAPGIKKHPICQTACDTV